MHKNKRFANQNTKTCKKTFWQIVWLRINKFTWWIQQKICLQVFHFIGQLCQPGDCTIKLFTAVIVAVS